MADDIRLTVSSPSGALPEKSVSYVKLPTEDGSLGILRGHAPMLCAISEGRLCYRRDGDEQQELWVGSGVATVKDDRVLLLVSEFRENI